MQRFLSSLFVAGAVVLGLGARASHTKTAKPIEGPAKIVDETEYEYVRVTGSNIPVKVPKSPTAHPLPPANNIMTMSPEEFREVVHRGQR